MDEMLGTTTELILDDGRIEPMKEYLSPEESATPEKCLF